MTFAAIWALLRNSWLGRAVAWAIAGLAGVLLIRADAARDAVRNHEKEARDADDARADAVRRNADAARRKVRHDGAADDRGYRD